MTEHTPEPNEEEIEAAEADVEGHSIEEEPGVDGSTAPVLDVNFGCA
jgi:hypothetical protein